MIRVFVADSHPIIHAGIRTVLEKDLEIKIIGEAETGRDTMNNVKKTSPDVILLDNNFLDIDGKKVVREIQYITPAIKILVLSYIDDADNVLAMLDAGIKGYVLKTESVQTIVDAIKLVAKGYTWISPTIAGKLIGRMKRSVENSALSDREIEILQRVANGDSNSQIAQMLNISTATVKNHLTVIYNKLNVTSRFGAIKWAMENKIVENRARG